jgi:hypothetical protein
MTYYNLKVVKTNETMSAAAADIQHALAMFGGKLNVQLTLEGAGASLYMLDEYTEVPHWVKYTIPVYEKK